MLDKMMKPGGSMGSRPVGGLEPPSPPAGSAAGCARKSGREGVIGRAVVLGREEEKKQ